MKLSKYSKNKIMETFKHWSVPRDFAEPMYNYLVFGYYPGGCFTSVLANDFHSAMMSSHPGNTVQAFKALAGWIRDILPMKAYSSYQAVAEWTQLNSEERRSILENHRLIFNTAEETWLILQDEPIKEVVLY